MTDMTRREFLTVTGTSLAGSSLALLGFSPREALAEVREFKLAHATETRNTCPYCSVSCGVLMYSLGDKAKNARSSIFHIEGDPDHPVNRGTLCPKGAALIDLELQGAEARRVEGAKGVAPALLEQRVEGGSFRTGGNPSYRVVWGRAKCVNGGRCAGPRCPRLVVLRGEGSRS